jgi:hypothetical protein
MPLAMRYATRLIAFTSLLSLGAMLGPGTGALAQKLDANALVDFGAALPSGERSFQKGGLGKLEFGADSGRPLPIGQALADIRAQLAPPLVAFATLRLAPDQHAPLDVIEAYARYQPVSNRALVWSLKGGAFFPPISLENEGVGWTSPWTLTPAAINSWIGQELRAVGAESSVEWRHDTGSVGVTGAFFFANDPVGTLLADRGWTFDSRPAGIFGEPRRPDLVARQMLGRIPPIREEPFKEIDQRPGWYAGATWRQDGLGRIAALYYDNRADPGLSIGNDFAWRTKFASLAAELDIGDVVLLSQAMFGETTVEPFEDAYFKTNFQSVYLLAGYYFDDFRIAARIDVFATQQHNTGSGPTPGEHGHALTLAGTWTPRPWLRLTAELLRVVSERGQRLLDGLPPHTTELQGQLVARVLF